MSGIMFDLDGDHFYHSRVNHIELIDEEYLKKVMFQYKDTDITDFVLSVNGALSSVPSKVKTTIADKYLRKEEIGIKVDYTESCAKTAHHIYNILGLDLYKIWIEALKEININPWISFRMNDVHGQIFELPNFCQDDFFYAHIDEYARIHGRKPEFYFDRARDWLIEDVRHEMHDYIEEQLGVYDVYGIVLDFQREFVCFPPGREDEGRNVMTEFMRSVKTLVGRMEEKYGHKIKIALRCHPDPVECFNLGFDVITYAKERLIDMYIASPRFRTTNTDMPITYWKNLLSPYGVEIAGASERMIYPYPNAPVKCNSEETFQTVETHLGTAAGIFSQGADKYYIFNTFDETDEMIDGECKESNIIYKSDEVSVQDGTFKDGTYTLLTNAGSMEKISKRARKCIATFCDLNSVWKNISSQLPAELKEGGQPYYIKINTGALQNTDKVFLRLGADKTVEGLQVLINDVPVEFVCAEECGYPVHTKNKVYKFCVPEKAFAPYGQVIELIYRSKGSLIIDYADIIVIPQIED
ncbi:MAG: hypothetical protein J6B23_02645 [Clostridia bacterium]|nr:hypothetical protein [Clostridia bacterium]